MKKYVRSIPFSEKNKMILKQSITCACIRTVRTEERKDYCAFLHIESKTFFSQRNQVAITLS